MVLRRSRLVRVLVAIAMVALAAVGLRLSETDEDFEIVRGRVGEPVTLHEGTVTAGQVRVGTRLSREGEVYAETPGLFLVVNVEVAATGADELPLYSARVLTGSRRYDALGGPNVGSVPPGFAATSDVVFEVDPAVLADITMELAPTGIITAYAEHARIHLGITADNAEAWRAAGRDQIISTLEQTGRGI
jgi:hypothetical protein